MDKPVFISASASEHECIMDVVEFVAWCCASQGNVASTITGKLQAIKYFHVVEAGVGLPMESDLIARQLNGIKRAHTLAGSMALRRLPITLNELLGAGNAWRDWGPGGRVLYLCLLLGFFVGARAHELFKDDGGKVHPSHCLLRGDVAFFAEGRQLDVHDCRFATRVELMFRGHKGDQEQAGTVLVRTRQPHSVCLPRDSGADDAVTVLEELLSCNRGLSEQAPLSAFQEGGKTVIWSYRKATEALRKIAVLAGMDAKRVSLHSLRIGYATVLAAGGDVSERVIQKEGRWKSGISTYSVYTRDNPEDSEAVSRKLTDKGKRKRTMPGQSTRWNTR